MYSYIIGKIVEINPNYLVIDNHGIGYLIKVANPYSFNLDEEIKIYLYFVVKEDSHDLYGFRTTLERDFFIKLINVKGLGPKGALVILTSSVEETINNIQSGNNKYFAKFPGIGTKLSQQIILDLAGKLEVSQPTVRSDKYDKVVLALKSWGYKSDEIKKATKDYDFQSDLSINEMLKDILKKLA